MERKMWGMALIVFVLCVAVGSSMAGTTGKITGMVKDAGTGEALPGVSMVLEGTVRGAMTDAEGYYLILSVEPGMYSVTATMMGYDKETKTEVKVVADMTTTVDFALKEIVLEMKEIVVMAERPPVEPDKTSTKYVVTAEEIENLPIVRTTSDLVALQPGVALDGTHRIRGSDQPSSSIWSGAGSPDVKYMVDGITLVNYDSKGQAMFTGVNKSGVQEISVETGVMAAEFGNALGGIVNVITREGLADYHGWLEYRYILPGKKHWGRNVYDSAMHKGHAKWDDPSWVGEIDPETGRLVHMRTEYDNISGQEIEGSLSGPIRPNLSFFLSGKRSRMASPIPSVEKYGFLDDQGNFVPAPDNFQGMGNLTWRVRPDLKVKIGGVFQRYTTHNLGLSEGGIKGMGDSAKNLFLPEGASSAGKEIRQEEVEYIALTHTLSPRTFYDLRIARSRSKQDTLDVPLLTTVNRKDEEGWFNIGRQAAYWTLSDRERLSFKFDLTSQVTRSHLIKTGFELIRWDAWLTRFLFSSPDERRFDFYASGMEMGEGVNPIQMVFYLQDKMEFKGMVMNAGVRVDYFDTNSKEAHHIGMFSAPMWDRFTRAKNMPMREADPHIYFSPRLGISHPITDRAKIHFATGVFLQWPDLFYYYGKSYRSYGRGTDRDLNENGVIDPAEKWNNMYPTYGGHFGDPTLRPEKSTNFEVGADYNFYGDYIAGLVAYYKSETDQYTLYPNQQWIGKKRDRTSKYQRGLANGAWGDTRGIEVSLKKRFSNYFGFSASYNMQWSHSTSGALGNVVRRVMPDSLFTASAANIDPAANPDWYKGGLYWYYDFDVDPETGAEIPKVPSQADIEEWGHKNEEWLRTYKEKLEGNSVGTGYWEPLERLGGAPGDAGLWNVIFGYAGDVHAAKGGDKRHIGSFSLTFGTPARWDLGPKWFGGLFSNIHGNLVYKLQTGNQHWYKPPGRARVLRDGPMQTMTDLSVEKRFEAGRLQPVVFVEVRNLFSQKDVEGYYHGTRYTRYGLEVPEPTDETYQKYGDINDWRRYAGEPRQVSMGLRLTF